MAARARGKRDSNGEASPAPAARPPTTPTGVVRSLTMSTDAVAAPPLPTAFPKRRVDAGALAMAAAAVRQCTACTLCSTRTNAVPGDGTGRSGIVLVGEAPGRNEDETGLPFCGAAGKNLDAALAAAAIPRSSVFVTSVVKCRPPGNRDPTPAEKAACRPHLDAQLAALRPRVVVTLGRHAFTSLVDPVPERSFSQLAGTFVAGRGGLPVFVSLHPAAVIYRQNWKQQYLDDWRRFGAWARLQGLTARP